MEHPRGNLNASNRKHSKVQGEDDYSQSVRKKLSTSSRTGQACDRCKIRKIRCDSAVGGCSPCRQTQATCKTTDRITGKATVRGLTDILEGENRYLKAKLREAQQQLRELGVPINDGQSSPHYPSHPHAPPTEDSQWDAQQHNGSRRSTQATIDTRPEEATMFQRHIGNETGTLSQNPGFSMLRGTKLALFGMQVDLAEFAESTEEVNSPRTFEGFLEHLFNRTPALEPPTLPESLHGAKEYMQWYFRFLNPYTPILDKRDTNELLIKIYENPNPGSQLHLSAAEEVMVHMMFTLIKYQYGQRNGNPAMVEEAMSHFQYSIKFWPNLVRGQTLQDVQAMALIALQVRGFPRPGAAWYCCNLALTSALGIGLNRSAAAWSVLEPGKMTLHETEMRKRVFWTLYGMTVGLSGRLGRPMPLRLSDIDIEFPAPVHDNLAEEGGISEFRKCSFHVGIALCKILALSGELYGTFYSASGSRPEDYDAHVARFEADMRMLRNSIHPELQDASESGGEVHIFALYIELFALEFEFLLRHPLITPPNDPERFKEQLIRTRELVPKPLAVLSTLKGALCLDVPWYTVTTFLAMIFTTLFAEDQQQEDITETELNKLKVEMEMWLDILKAIGSMLGTGNELKTTVAHIIRSVIDRLSQRVAAKSAADVANEALHHSQQRTPSVADAYAAVHNLNISAGPPTISTEVKHENTTVYPVPDAHNHTSTTQATYPTAVPAAHFQPYTDAGSSTPAPYPNNPYVQPNYNNSEQIAAQLPISAGQPQQPSAPIYSPPGPGPVPYYATDMQSTPTHEWLRWGQATMGGFPSHAPQEFMPSPAATLMTMSGRTSGINGAQNAAATQDAPSQWPMSVYNIGQNGGNPAG